jgi:acyl carrier protein
MTENEIRAAIIAELGNIAPEMDIASVDPHADLREALDIDSMDFLNFIMALHKKLGVEVPEKDYPKLVTLAGAVAYLGQPGQQARAH